MRERLGDQHAVEGIAVRPWQMLGPLAVGEAPARFGITLLSPQDALRRIER